MSRAKNNRIKFNRQRNKGKDFARKDMEARANKRIDQALLTHAMGIVPKFKKILFGIKKK